MLYTNTWSQSFLGSKKEIFTCFVFYVYEHGRHLGNGVCPFEQNVKLPLTKRVIQKYVKPGQVVSVVKFKAFMVLYTYIVQGTGAENPWGIKF